jgi:hypothetical protein
MRIDRHLRELSSVLTAVLLGLCMQATSSAQSDRSDRPGPEEGRTSRSERHDDRDRAPDRRSPEEISRQRWSKYSTAPRTEKFRAFAAMAGGTSENDLRRAFEQANQDYKSFVAQAGSNYIAVRPEDFAPAYFIVMDPRVSGKRNNGLAFAKEASTLKYRAHYAKLLHEELGLDKNTAKEIENAAREAVKSFEK